MIFKIHNENNVHKKVSGTNKEIGAFTTSLPLVACNDSRIFWEFYAIF